MAEEKKKNLEKGVKKLDEFKDSEENKRVVEEKLGKGDADEKGAENKEESGEENEPQISQMNADSESKKEKGGERKSKKGKVEEVVELEREYVVPLRRGFLRVPRYKRAKRAVRVLKEFMVRHMGVRDGDLRKVKIDGYLNNEIWFRGIKKPMGKVRVRAKKIGGIVYVELADEPEVVKFAKLREEKRKSKVEKVKSKKVKEEVVEKDKDKDGVDDKKEEAEDRKAGAEKETRLEKAVAKEMKHTAKGKHFKKTMPVRKSLKK